MGEVFVVVAVRDDRGDVEAGFEEDGHLVPGFVHFAAVDALDGEHVEDDGLPVDGEFFGRNAEEGDVAAVRHVDEHVAKRLRIARHFHAYVKAFFHAEVFLIVCDRRFGDVDGVFDAVGAGEFEAFGIDVGDHDVTRTGVFSDRGGHDADRAGTGDEHVFAKDFEGQGSVDGVAKWIEYRRNIEVDVFVVLPDVRVRHGHVFGKTAVGIDPVTQRVRTLVPTPGETVATTTADEMAFDTDDVADLEIIDVRADLDDLTDEFVTENCGDFDGRLRPRVPIPDVNVRPANSSTFHADQHVVDANRRFRNVLEPQSFFRLAFYDRFHDPRLPVIFMNAANAIITEPLPRVHSPGDASER